MNIENGKVTLSFDVGTKNLAYCLIRNKDERIIDWNVVDVGAPTYDKQCQKMIEALDQIDYSIGYPDDTKQSIVVVIERQPSLNPRMRVISGQIQMYYALEKKACSQNDDLVFIEKVVYYSPKLKLRCYTLKDGDIPIIVKKYATSYAFRKNLAIQHCNIIINRKTNNEYEQAEVWRNMFDKKKGPKADLSDSFLQGLAHLRGI
jgi:hypothetical protein